jgi:hypothetical protein
METEKQTQKILSSLKQEKEFISSEEIEWKKIGEGIFEKVLNEAEDGLSRSVLQKWEKGL